MAEIDVITADIAAASKKMDALAAIISNTKPGSDLSGVTGALPDSATATAVDSLATAWADRFSAFHRDADEFAMALKDSAQTYDQADLNAALQQQALEVQSVPIRPSNSRILAL